MQVALADWRSLHGEFDKIASAGMFEHVGPKNYCAYFKRMRQLLTADGLFLLHTIGVDRTERSTNAWTDRYIFPGGKLPSAQEITRAVEGCFVIEDWHAFGADYDRTLLAGISDLKRPGLAWAPATTNGFAACGGFICSRAPASFVRARGSCGRSCWRRASVCTGTEACAEMLAMRVRPVRPSQVDCVVHR